MPRFSPPTLTSSLLSAYSRQTGKKRKLYLGRKSLKLLIRKHTFHHRLFIVRKGILWWSSTLENKPHQWCWLVKKSLAPIFICSLVLLVEGIRARKALSVFWSLRISSGNYTFFFPHRTSYLLFSIRMQPYTWWASSTLIGVDVLNIKNKPCGREEDSL